MHIGGQVRVSFLHSLPWCVDLALTLDIPDWSSVKIRHHPIGHSFILWRKVLPPSLIRSYLTWGPDRKLKAFTVLSRKIMRSICIRNIPSDSLCWTSFLPNDLLVGLSPKTLITDTVTESCQGHKPSPDSTLHQCSPHKQSSWCSNSITEKLFSTLLPSSGHKSMRNYAIFLLRNDKKNYQTQKAVE